MGILIIDIVISASIPLIKPGMTIKETGSEGVYFIVTPSIFFGKADLLLPGIFLLPIISSVTLCPLFLRPIANPNMRFVVEANKGYCEITRIFICNILKLHKFQSKKKARRCVRLFNYGKRYFKN